MNYIITLYKIQSYYIGAILLYIKKLQYLLKSTLNLLEFHPINLKVYFISLLYSLSISHLIYSNK